VTHPKAWYYRATPSIKYLEQTQGMHGVIRILVSVKGARAGLGFLGEDQSYFLKRIQIKPKEEPQEVFFEFENLADLKRFVIQTWNQDKSAKVRILEFSIRGTP